MTVTCRVYFNTGFNAVNIPDSPTLLNQMSYVDVAALDLNQERILPSVRIRTAWNTIKNGDYCKLNDFFYFIDNIYMIAGDVAELTLVPDFVTSAGGPAALNILDGITNRVHVSDDTFGLYGENDPYMSPAYDMDVAVDETSGDFSSSGNYVFVETTLDLFKLGQYSNDDASFYQPAITAYDDSDDTKYVVYPTVPYRPSGGETQYAAVLGGSTSYTLQSTQGMSLYDITDTSSTPYSIVAEGIARARALGIEQAISGQFAVPSAFVTKTMLNAGVVGELSGKGGTRATSGVDFIYGIANNNRVFYGSQSPYTLIAASGSSVSAEAQEIYQAGYAGPRIRYAVDPRRDGKPYYRFEVMHGNSASSNKLEIFRNGIAGNPWRNVPMVFTEKSGGLLDRVSYNASRAMSELDRQQTRENYEVAQATNKIGFAANAGGAILSGNIGGAVSAAVNAGIADYTNQVSYNQYNQKFRAQKAIEEQQFAISQNVNVPTIMFPASSDLFNDVTNNGYIVTRAIYKQEDISRIDKILTAYGYKHTKRLESSDFTNRTYFNYVQANVSVGDLPKWFADGVGAQLSNGVRVWHVKPSGTYYSNNPIAS